MTDQPQLEIISPSGEIRFHELDPAKGVTNIGRHPENDVVIDSPDVAPFHALLDHRQRPFHVTLLSAEGETTLEDRLLAPNAPVELHDWDTIQVNGYALILLDTGRDAVSAPPVPGLSIPSSESAESEGRREPGPGSQAPAPMPESAVSLGPIRLPALPPDQRDRDGFVVAELSSREWAIDAGQTATCQVTVVNGGTLVARFEVTVDGLDPSWVTVSPPQTNLNEGEEQNVGLYISPPRDPTSLAGTHYLSIVIASREYPGHVCRLGATLTINPYYEFSVGEPSPKQQTVGWVKRAGELDVPIANRGNSEAAFRLEAGDDERACRFEFQVPGEEATLVRQAEVRQPPGQAATVPVLITPPRRFIALRRRTYSFTVTTALVGSDQMPRSVMGRLKSAPLVGPWLILLIALCLLALLGFLFRPNRAPGLQADNLTISEPGGAVTLSYNASRFDLRNKSLLSRLNSLFLRLALERQIGEGSWQPFRSAELQVPIGEVVEVPSVTGKYRLTANSWVSRIVSALEGVSEPVEVVVPSVSPQILALHAAPNPAFVGEVVTLYWETIYAESVMLQRGEVQETLKEDELGTGQRTVTLDRDTTFVLMASNSSGARPVQDSEEIKILYPTPAVRRFDVAPETIVQGQNVEINWEVENADSVDITNLGAGYPVMGNEIRQPLNDTVYSLRALKVRPDNTTVASDVFIRSVRVSTPTPTPTLTPTPTPTPTPAPPVIQVFEASPKTVVAGDKEKVELRWVIAGPITNIEISAPDFQRSGLPKDDSMKVTVDETTLFILTAYNGDIISSASLEITAEEPTPLPPPPPTPVPPPLIEYFKAEEGTTVVFRAEKPTEAGPTYVYDVEAGSEVKLIWSVAGNVEKVELLGYGPQTFQGEKVLTGAENTENKTYQLSAENQAVPPVYAFVRLEVYPPDPPLPPYDVEGQVDSGVGITISWAYDESRLDEITGFRVYQAQLPDSDFSRVGPLVIPASTESEFYSPEEMRFFLLDTIKAPKKVCDRAYYVVALYWDIIEKEEKETDASTTSWYSAPCSP